MEVPQRPAQQRKEWLARLGVVPAADVADGAVVDTVLAFAAADADDDHPFSLETLMMTLPDKHTRPQWAVLARTVASLLPAPGEPPVTNTDALKVLRAVASCGVTFAAGLAPADGPSGATVPAHDEFLAAVTSLHDALWVVDGADGVAVQEVIADACEKVWQSALPGRHACTPALALFLLMRCIADGGREIDLRRLHANRTALAEFDLNDDNTQQLRELLLQAFRHPVFLRHVEGRRFLAYTMTLDVGLVDDIHTVVKNNLPGCPAAAVNAYGEVYHRAWANAVAAVKLRIEQACLQDLMNSGIHAAQPATFKVCRRMIDAWVQKKKDRGVDEVLLRCYDAVLWRSLTVANPDVRRNATVLLVDAFPLQNPSLPREATDALLQKQTDALSELLNDPVPSVRVAAAQGVCRVLGTYWELVPKHSCKALLRKVATELTRDVASAAVRATALRGIEFLAKNVYTLPAVHRVLPSLAPLLHDRSERVRAAFVDLLLHVSTIRDVHWYDIVDVEQLLARLAMAQDSTEVVSAITQLLMPSFFPQGVRGVEQYKRAMRMITDHEAAALVFFANVHRHAPVPSVVKLVLLLGKALRVTAAKAAKATARHAVPGQKRGRRRPADDDDSDAEDDAAADGDSAGDGSDSDGSGGRRSKLDLKAMAGLIKTIVATWASVEPVLADCPSSKQALLDAFGGGVLVELLEALVVPSVGRASRRVANSRRRKVLSAAAQAAASGTNPHAGTIAAGLFHMASLLPAKAVKGLGDAVWQKLDAASPDVTDAELEPLVQVVCRWQQLPALVRRLVAALAEVADAESASASSSTTAAVLLRAFALAVGRDVGDARAQAFGSMTELTAAFTTARDTLTALACAPADTSRAAMPRAHAMGMAVGVGAKLALHHAATTAAADGSQLQPPRQLVELLDWVVDSALPALAAFHVLVAGSKPVPVHVHAVSRAVYDAASAVVATAGDCAAAGGVDDALAGALARLAASEGGADGAPSPLAVLQRSPPALLKPAVLFSLDAEAGADAEAAGAGAGAGADVSDDENEAPLGAAAAKRRADKAAATAATAATLLHHTCRLAKRLDVVGCAAPDAVTDSRRLLTARVEAVRRSLADLTAAVAEE